MLNIAYWHLSDNRLCDKDDAKGVAHIAHFIPRYTTFVESW